MVDTVGLDEVTHKLKDKFMATFGDRYKHFYQQLYVGFIIFNLITYYLGKFIIKFTKFFCKVISTIVMSIIDFFRQIRHNFKNGTGFCYGIKKYCRKPKKECVVVLTKKELR
jgi:hypothetical protein